MVLSIFVTTTISLGALSLLLDLMYSMFGKGVFIYPRGNKMPEMNHEIDDWSDEF